MQNAHVIFLRVWTWNYLLLFMEVLMHPDPSELIRILEIDVPLIGVYDTDNPEAFEPLVRPKHCIFECYESWLSGQSLCLRRDDHGCGGAGFWLFGVETLVRESAVRYLTWGEGVRVTSEMTEAFLDQVPPYSPTNSHVIIGPLKKDNHDSLRSVTFFVTPDQLGMLLAGCHYEGDLDAAAGVTAPFASGCSQLLTAVISDSEPKAIIGATSTVLRRFLPPHLLALVCNPTMFARLCRLDKDSFLYKSYWEALRRVRDTSERKSNHWSQWTETQASGDSGIQL
jgi:COG2043 family uncharacterized protein